MSHVNGLFADRAIRLMVACPMPFPTLYPSLPQPARSVFWGDFRIPGGPPDSFLFLFYFFSF